MQLANPLARAALCTAVAMVAAACSSGADGNTDGGATSDVAKSSSVTAAGNTDETGYVGDVPTIAMRASFTGNVQQAVAGRQAFIKYNCYGCHGGLAGGAMGPSLRDDEWKYGGTDEQIMSSLHQGRPAGMPAWRGVATEQELRDIVTYIRTMRTPQEPTFFFSVDDTTTKTAFLVPHGEGGQQGGTSVNPSGGTPGTNVQGQAATAGQPGNPSPSTGSSSQGVPAGSGTPKGGSPD
jgi:cytochrome c oxidase cbb3-type subunit 3